MTNLMTMNEPTTINEPYDYKRTLRLNEPYGYK